MKDPDRPRDGPFEPTLAHFLHPPKKIERKNTGNREEEKEYRTAHAPDDVTAGPNTPRDSGARAPRPGDVTAIEAAPGPSPPRSVEESPPLWAFAAPGSEPRGGCGVRALSSFFVARCGVAATSGDARAPASKMLPPPASAENVTFPLPSATSPTTSSASDCPVAAGLSASSSARIAR